MTDLVKRLEDEIDRAFDERIGLKGEATPSIIVGSQRRELARIAATTAAAMRRAGGK